MNGWWPRNTLQEPYWDDVASLVSKLPEGEFPCVEELNRLLPPEARNQCGQQIRLVSSEHIPAVQYEQHIYATGEVSTRAGSWHDLFNAMMWMRFPRLKSAMNAVHHAAMGQSSDAGRGRQRDALTLFDECGVIVAGVKKPDLESMARRDWPRVFEHGPVPWDQRFRVFICGHAMLEKLLQPYKSMTANSLLVRVSEQVFEQDRRQLRLSLDSELSKQMLAGRLFEAPADLSPLPLMGIPGWWAQGRQNAGFYADQQVFRPPPAAFRPAPVFPLH
jgi:hypothetical protein